MAVEESGWLLITVGEAKTGSRDKKSLNRVWGPWRNGYRQLGYVAAVDSTRKRGGC